MKKEQIENLAEFNKTSTFNSWKFLKFLGMNGVFAGGWTSDERFVLVNNYDNLCIFNPKTGIFEIEYLEIEYNPYRKRNDGIIEFLLPDLDNSLILQSTDSGYFKHTTLDGWKLEKTYPFWPEETIILMEPGFSIFNENYAKKAVLMNLDKIASFELKMSFSSLGNFFTIFGNTGAYIYTRYTNDERE